MMHNDFQPALVQIIPEHNDWLTAGMDEGALAAQTIDRGPSLLFVADTQDAAYQLAERYEQRMDITAIAEYGPVAGADRKSTRLNASHVSISYGVFCLNKKQQI